MRKKIWIILLVVFVVLSALAAVGYFGFLKPYMQAVSAFPQERMVEFYQRSDGRLEMHWPEATNTNRYLLEVLIPQAGVDPEEWPVEYSADVIEKTQHVLMPMTGAQRAIRIRSAKAYQYLFESRPRYRLSEDCIFLQDTFVCPDAPTPQWVADPDTDTVTASFTMGKNCYARLYHLTDTAETPCATQLSGDTVLTFGEEQQFPMPKHDQYLEFAFDAYRQEEGYVFYSTLGQTYTVTREDLLGTYINLSSQLNDDTTYTLKWGEAKGDYYILQHRDTEKDSWEDVKRYQLEDNLTYTTAAYEPYTSRQFRVITYRADGQQALEQISGSDELTIDVKSVINYTTMWPIKDLTVYTDAAKTQEAGVTISGGTAYWILDLEEDMFKIRVNGDLYGYVDSNYCMINLPEFVGDLLEYDIANSYASLFNFHGVPIDGVTGQVVTGYEKVMHDTNTYLVPLLYPSALKLEQAGVTAREKGYCLKIFDSYRPQVATRDLYSRMESKCDEPIPLPTVMPAYNETPGKPNKPSTEPLEPLDEEYLALFMKDEETPMTYQEFITDNNRYTLNYFLANGTSRHNRGAALDMTLTKNGKNLEMQTIIHDLCWYSETKSNTSAAKTLASIMKSAGFGGLSSEWWHFQDDAALKNLNPPALKKGVTPECWVTDGQGWLYRQSNGDYIRNITKTIDGVSYRFNESGYASLA